MSVYKCASASLARVLFGDNNDEWLTSRDKPSWMHAVRCDSASLRMSWRIMSVVCQKGRGRHRCPWVVRAERSTEVHLTDTVNKTCLLCFFCQRWKSHNKRVSYVVKNIGTVDLVTLNKVYKLCLVRGSEQTKHQLHKRKGGVMKTHAQCALWKTCLS